MDFPSFAWVNSKLSSFASMRSHPERNPFETRWENSKPYSLPEENFESFATRLKNFEMMAVLAAFSVFHLNDA